MQRRRRLPSVKVALSVTGYDQYLVSGARATASNSPATFDSATGIVIAEQVADE